MGKRRLYESILSTIYEKLSSKMWSLWDDQYANGGDSVRENRTLNAIWVIIFKVRGKLDFMIKMFLIKIYVTELYDTWLIDNICKLHVN